MKPRPPLWKVEWLNVHVNVLYTLKGLQSSKLDHVRYMGSKFGRRYYVLRFQVVFPGCSDLVDRDNRARHGSLPLALDHVLSQYERPYCSEPIRALIATAYASIGCCYSSCTASVSFLHSSTDPKINPGTSLCGRAPSFLLSSTSTSSIHLGQCLEHMRSAHLCCLPYSQLHTCGAL